jgi:hypothetical protein
MPIDERSSMRAKLGCRVPQSQSYVRNPSGHIITQEHYAQDGFADNNLARN